MSEPPVSGPSPDDELRLSERDAEIHRVLSEQDEGLAGLFLFLLRAMAEVERPGGVHMLGHAGRELSLGVLRYLAGDDRPLPQDNPNCAKKNEKFRSTIARALRLQPDHPSVSAWFRAHNELVSFAHYTRARSSQPSSQSDALAAANALIALVWSRTGPFFGAQGDVERLLAREVPTESDILALRTSLSRPAVRWDFFKRLEHPGWVAPLTKAGFFDHPPDLLPPDEEGRQRWEGWSEGEYLHRMADKVPVDVREALQRIPETNRNPFVWDSAARAAKAMPVADAVKLVPLFRKALANSLPWMLQERLGELAVKLAEAGLPEAFGLAHDVVRIVEGKPSPAALIEGTDRKEAALDGLDDYEAEQLLPRLAEALEKVNDDKALRFFVHKLDDALRVEWTDPSQEPSWDPSQHWCPDLSEAQSHHGFKEQIAVAIAKLAASATAKSPEDARRVLEFLASQPWRVYRRVTLFVLSKAGQNAPEQLSSVVADTRLVEEKYPPHEYILLLQNQYQNASPESQNVLKEAILQGPGTTGEILSLPATDEDSDSPTLKDAHKYRVRWQRKRLRRFGDNLPAALAQLASQLEQDTSVPTPQGWELELEDRGSAGGMWASSGPRSPLTNEQLKQLSAQQLIEYLREYRPVRDRFDSPTPAGLATAIATRVREEPSFAAVLAPLLPGAGLQAAYVRGVLEGLVGAADEERQIQWSGVLPLVTWVANQPTGGDSGLAKDLHYGEVNWRWAKREAAKLVALAASKNLAAPADSDAIWTAAESLILSNSTWEERQELPDTMDAALTASLNTVAGESVESLLEVALWNYRLSRPEEANTEPEDGGSSGSEGVPFEVTRLRAGLEAVLRRTGSSSYTARVRLGQYLPQLLLMDRDWVLEKSADLFGDDFSPPLTNAVWGGYITRQDLYNKVFEDLRSWYVRAAEALPEPNEQTLLGEQKDSTWSTTRHLVVHCLLAVLRGLASVSDRDGLIPLAFERSPVADRSHAYWEVYRGWKGPAGSVPAVMIERLLNFWSWRLDVLSLRTEQERKAEAGALGWLALVNALPDDRVLPLLSQTTEQAGGHFRMEHSMWDRMERFGELDVDSTVTVVDRIIRAVLQERYPHFNLSDVGPILTLALHSNSPIARQKATDLVNLLGDNGFTEFGSLL